MSDTNKIILAILGVIAIVLVYIYTQSGYAPYTYPTPSESPSVSSPPTPTPSPSLTQSPKISPTPSVKPSPTSSPIPKPSASSTPTPVPPTPTPSPFTTPTPTPSTAPKIDIFNISAVEFSYSPNSITAKSGDTIKINFTNNGAYSHNLTFQGFNAATQTIGPGQTAMIQFTAPAAGTYTFFCSVDSHKDLGMIGTLIVQ